VLESLDGDTIVGSGLTKTAEEQMETLSFNAAKLIQRYITRQHRSEQWFKRKPATQAALDAAVQDAPAQAAETAAQTAVEEAAETAVAQAEDAVKAAAE